MKEVAERQRIGRIMYEQCHQQVPQDLTEPRPCTDKAAEATPCSRLEGEQSSTALRQGLFGRGSNQAAAFLADSLRGQGKLFMPGAQDKDMREYRPGGRDGEDAREGYGDADRSGLTDGAFVGTLAGERVYRSGDSVIVYRSSGPRGRRIVGALEVKTEPLQEYGGWTATCAPLAQRTRGETQREAWDNLSALVETMVAWLLEEAVSHRPTVLDTMLGRLGFAAGPVDSSTYEEVVDRIPRMIAPRATGKMIYVDVSESDECGEYGNG